MQITPSDGSIRDGRQQVARVKAVSVTNKQPETPAIAGEGAAASFAETENRREQRTDCGLKPDRAGQRRPSQKGRNPRPYWACVQKRKGDRTSLSPVIGGVKFTTEQLAIGANEHC